MTRLATSRMEQIVVIGTCWVVAFALPTLLPAQSKKESPPAAVPPEATTRKADTDRVSRAQKDADADPEPRREPSATDVLRRLKESKRGGGRPVIVPVQPGGARTRVAPDALPKNAIVPTANKLLPDGYRLVDRPGRLTREDDYFVFAFESRGLGTPDLPIRLLPNRLLEDMEIQSSGGTVPIVFIVSGEVTEYHGVNYLLIQKLLIRPDLGNLQ